MAKHVFDNNGKANSNGIVAYETIDPAISAIFASLTAAGYSVNDIYTLVSLSAADARVSIVLENAYGDNNDI